MKDKKLSLIYYVLLAVGILAGIGFIISVLSSLTSTDPIIINGIYDQLGYMAWTMFGLFLVYMILQNLIYFREGSKAWPYLFSALVFMTFTAINFLWLGPKLWQRKAELELWEGGFDMRPLAGIVVFGLAMGVTLINFLVARSFRKTREMKSVGK